MPKVEKRPEWTFQLPYEDALWIYQNFIKRIECGYDMTSPDECVNWIEAVVFEDDSFNTEIDRRRFILNQGFRDCVRIQLIHGSLLDLESHVWERVNDIVLYDAVNEEQLKLYRKLKEKFGDV